MSWTALFAGVSAPCKVLLTSMVNRSRQTAGWQRMFNGFIMMTRICFVQAWAVNEFSGSCPRDCRCQDAELPPQDTASCKITQETQHFQLGLASVFGWLAARPQNVDSEHLLPKAAREPVKWGQYWVLVFSQGRFKLAVASFLFAAAGGGLSLIALLGLVSFAWISVLDHRC